MENLNQLTKIERIKKFAKPITGFIKRNIGLGIVIAGYFIPLFIFILGVVLVEDTWSPDSMEISNRTFIWVIAIPFFMLVLTFLGQLIYFRWDTQRELKELIRIYEKRLKELKEIYRKRLNDAKNYSDLFSLIDNVSNQDIYSSTIFTFLIEKMKNDINSIRKKNFIAEGWYWKISNKFVLSEKKALCSCILSYQQLTEADIREYFIEQYKSIKENKFILERVLIVNSLKDLKNYSSFVAEQINNNVEFYILSRDFSELKNLSDEEWNNNFKRDFALINSKFLIEAQITNDDIKGYEINQIDGNIPIYAINVNKYKRKVERYIESFSDNGYNPIKEILENKNISK